MMVQEKKLADELKGKIEPNRDGNQHSSDPDLQRIKASSSMHMQSMKLANIIATSGTLKLGYIAGVLKTADVEHYMRSLYRITRGKIILDQVSFDDEMMAALVDKTDDESKNNLTAFLVITTFNEKEGNLQKRLSAISTSFQVKLFPLPPSGRQLDHIIEELEGQYKDLSNLKVKADENVLQKLESLAEVHPVGGSLM